MSVSSPSSPAVAPLLWSRLIERLAVVAHEMSMNAMYLLAGGVSRSALKTRATATRDIPPDRGPGVMSPHSSPAPSPQNSCCATWKRAHLLLWLLSLLAVSGCAYSISAVSPRSEDFTAVASAVSLAEAIPDSFHLNGAPGSPEADVSGWRRSLQDAFGPGRGGQGLPHLEVERAELDFVEDHVLSAGRQGAYSYNRARIRWSVTVKKLDRTSSRLTGSSVSERSFYSRPDAQVVVKEALEVMAHDVLSAVAGLR